jgi:hypothetical protein
MIQLRPTLYDFFDVARFLERELGWEFVDACALLRKCHKALHPYGNGKESFRLKPELFVNCKEFTRQEILVIDWLIRKLQIEELCIAF